ncbi:hypothetical protein PCANC_03329 [Puccinia coronata f. sp. avenae]|uniref:Uncharacterized protein n=1 Tax=Puccinia coronata f. sp. avenae TaxID=200324 RepID=A0A2N5T8T5_9BASI|nr:hypothetical protein PCANC_03329 [Puccinia coronata f. sp. avenae]
MACPAVAIGSRGNRLTVSVPVSVPQLGEEEKRAGRALTPIDYIQHGCGAAQYKLIPNLTLSLQLAPWLIVTDMSQPSTQQVQPATATLRCKKRCISVA